MSIQYNDSKDGALMKEIESSNIYQKNLTKFFIIALHIFGITTLVFLIFLLVTDAKSGKPLRPDFPIAPCVHKRNESFMCEPVPRSAQAGLG